MTIEAPKAKKRVKIVPKVRKLHENYNVFFKKIHFTQNVPLDTSNAVLTTMLKNFGQNPKTIRLKIKKRLIFKKPSGSRKLLTEMLVEQTQLRFWK